MALLLACGNFHCPGSDPRVAELIIHALERGGGSAGQWVGEICPHCIGLDAPASVNSVPAANLRRMRGHCGLNSRPQAQLGTCRASANRRAWTCRAGGVRDCNGPAALAIAPNFSHLGSYAVARAWGRRAGRACSCLCAGRERSVPYSVDLTLSATDAIGNVMAVGLSGGASQEESNLVRSHARFQDLGVGNDEILSTTEYYYIVRGIHSTRAGARGSYRVLEGVGGNPWRHGNRRDIAGSHGVGEAGSPDQPELSEVHRSISPRFHSRAPAFVAALTEGECSGRFPRVLCAVDVQVALTETLGRPVIASAGVSASQSDALVRGVGNEMDTSTS